MSDARGIAVVTGAGSGIGRELALALARRGHRLALLGRTREALEATLAAAGGDGGAFEIDVVDVEQWRELVPRIEGELGVVEIVVAAAGVARVGRFDELAPEAIRDSIATNLIGAALTFRAFLPGLRERGRGVLVPILSVAARRTFPGWSAYAASKWGLLGLVESLREELAGTGVRVLALTPGATDTGIWESVEGDWQRDRMIPVAELGEILGWALDPARAAAVEEIRVQPRGGNL